MKRNGSEKPRRIKSIGPERFLENRAELHNYLFLLNARDKIREWLKSRGYLEALLPSLAPETVPDLNLESFAVEFKSVFIPGQKSTLYLQTSPELLLKRLLASGVSAVFYLGPAFRQGELAEKHHPEFTMAEWYRAGFSYLDLMAEMEKMLAGLFGLQKPFLRMTLREAMVQASGIDFLQLQKTSALARAIQSRLKSFDAQVMDFCDLLEFAMVQWLDPWLIAKDAVFIYDWPFQLAMQARLKPGDPRLAERFELYLRGLEIANGYTEAVAGSELKQRFRAEIQKRKKTGRKTVPLPEKFLAGIALGLPPCAGVSLGLERLCMALLGLDNLDRLMAFREI